MILCKNFVFYSSKIYTIIDIMLCEIQVDTEKLLHINNNDDFSNVPKIDCNISYCEFFENYLLKNKPCILSNIFTSWPCSKNWVQNNLPNFSYLRNRYKHLEVCISDCNVKSYDSHQTQCLNFNEYLNYWEDYIKCNYSKQKPVLYLKDWHLKRLTNENFYIVPIFFASDWLNEYFTEKTNDDYKFVYMGPSGTWTPFHADVFTSFSWSVNICGKKKWVLFPPGEEEYLKDKVGNLPYDVTKVDHQRKFFEIIQLPGDAIFVPSGWHHQVWNLEDTISVNHNWVNGCNILNMWQSLTYNLHKVKKEIADCRDMDGWSEHCQLMLKTSYGLDFNMFYDFLHHIAIKRINFITNNLQVKHFDTWILGENHAKFDILKIKFILELFLKHSDFNEINLNKNNLTPQELMLIIEKIKL